MHIVHHLDSTIWREFVVTHPNGNIFHTPEMFEVFAQTKGYYPELWAVMDDNQNQILALFLPVRITLIDGPLSRLTSRAVAYGSILAEPGHVGEQALVKLFEAYRQYAKSRVIFTELRNLSNLANLQLVLQNHQFIYEDHLNFLVNLNRPVAEIWGSLEANARSNVKRAQKRGIIITEADSFDTAHVAYDILQEVYKLVQVPLSDFSLFEAAFRCLQSQGMAKFFMAQVNDTYIGASIVLLYKDIIYSWYAGACREYSACKAGDLLNWHVLEWGAEHGFSCFDFGGAGKPDEDYGPRKFKAKFGGTLVNFGRNICVHQPVALKFSKFGYQLTRKFL